MHVRLLPSTMAGYQIAHVIDLHHGLRIDSKLQDRPAVRLENSGEKIMDLKISPSVFHASAQPSFHEP